MAVCTALALLSCSAPRSLAHGHCVCGHRVRGPRAHGLCARAVSEPGRGLGLGNSSGWCRGLGPVWQQSWWPQWQCRGMGQFQGWQGSLPVALRAGAVAHGAPSVTAALLCSVGACASLQLSAFSQKFPKVEISPDKN